MERAQDQRNGWGGRARFELGEKFFSEIIRHPVPLDHEYPEGPQAMFVGSGSLPMAYLPHLCAEASATPLLASGLPSVRGRSRQNERSPNNPKLPPEDPAGVEENQDRLARTELHNGYGSADTHARKILCAAHLPAPARGIVLKDSWLAQNCLLKVCGALGRQGFNASAAGEGVYPQRPMIRGVFHGESEYMKFLILR